jgi:CO/xanthine dehydrogenase Mo-binding subunit
VEIAMQDNAPRVERVVAAVDCGEVVNPNILEQQVHSAIIFGLSAALRGKITIEHGQVQQANFDTFSILRMNELPVIETYAVESHEPPTGIGEPPVPPLAPALCNAIYAATKKRIRALPIVKG